ncbi:MAG: TraB/VirB10 family protein, partial [Sinobacteraceae bacterium]|nr:TraB/VirB10 family protein [Nevskiaceae bacterium]
QDGGVIEVGLEAYAAGEDGKVGLRGRVVSKQGQLLAKSLAAGFFSGMSQVFNKAPVPTITTTSSGEVQYQDVLSSDSITAGAVKGASSALDRLAQYYLDMAKDIFPVIEINANRRIDFVVTRGASLQIVGAGDSASPATTSKGKKDS